MTRRFGPGFIRARSSFREWARFGHGGPLGGRAPLRKHSANPCPPACPRDAAGTSTGKRSTRPSRVRTARVRYSQAYRSGVRFSPLTTLPPAPIAAEILCGGRVQSRVLIACDGEAALDGFRAPRTLQSGAGGSPVRFQLPGYLACPGLVRKPDPSDSRTTKPKLTSTGESKLFARRR